MPYLLAPYECRQYFDDNGDPLNGGLVYTYLAGTATPATTYSNSTGTQNSNPIVLSASGRCQMYLDATSYKILVTTATGTPVGPTYDPVTSTAVGVGSAIQVVYPFGGNPSVAIISAGYPSGAGFDKLHAGTGVCLLDSTNLSGTYKIQATGLTAPGCTLSVTLVNLSDGSPDVSLATLTISNSTGAIGTSGAITFAAPGLSKQYGIKVKVDSNTAYAWAIQLIRTA